MSNIDRSKFIGGSDIAAVMGLSRWKTPLQLWAEKTGQVEEKDLSNIEAVQLGIELEDFVAKKFQKKTGLDVRRAPKYYIHPKYNFLSCQVDRLVTGTDELLECKTAHYRKAKEWEGEEIPIEYIMQVIWQLGITVRSKGWIAVLIGGQAFRYKAIPSDRDLFEKMIGQALKFWDMVKNNIPPMACADDREILLALYPQENNAELLQSYQEMENDIARRQELKGHIEAMKEEADTIDNKLRQVIGDNLGIKTQKYIVKNKLQNSVPKILTEQMKTDGVYDKYTEKKSVRMLRITLNKED